MKHGAHRRETESDLRLDSWKQIAAYLNRHMTTVRRWERYEGLPVHRHLHSKLASIYASSKELDAWLLKRHSVPSSPKLQRIVVPLTEGRLAPAFQEIDDPTPPVPGASLRFHAREPELQTLNEAWRKTRAGRQQLVFVAGEAGVGKTRLVTEFGSSLSGHASVFTGRCDRPPHLPFSPFVELLREIGQNVPAEALREWVQTVDGSAELLHLSPELARLTRKAPAPAATTLEGHRFRMFEAFRALVQSLVRTAPVLLVFEDIQWADEGSMLMLRYLVRAVQSIPLCVVVTYCETELQQVRWSAELLRDLGREASAPRIELAGLDDNGIRSVVIDWMGENAPDDLIRFIADVTQGNPLFITEMLRHLEETGAAGSVTLWNSQANRTGLTIPVTIREVIDRRLSRLSEPCNTLLTVASASGGSLRLSLAEAATQLPENVLLDVLDEAVNAGILCEKPGTHGAFSFTHALFKEAIYSRQTAERRMRLHHRLARTIERNADPAGLPVAELAYHFGRAAANGDAEKAVHYGILAGERAMAALAMEQAAGFYQSALASIEFLPVSEENRSKRLNLHASCARSLSQAGQWASAKQHLEAAVALVDVGNKAELAELNVGLAEASFWVLDIPGVRHYADQGQQLADEASRANLLADALAWKASAQAADGDVAGAVQSDQLAVAKAGGIRSFALARVPLTLYWAGRTAAAAEQARQAVEFARASGDAAFLLYALQHRGLSLAGLGEYDEAIRAFDEACTFGKRCGALPLLARATCMSVAPFLNIGDFEAARTRALEARELAHRAAFEPPLVSAGIDLLILQARTHNPGAGESLLRETRAAVEQAAGWHAWKWRLRLAQACAELALARGDWKDAIQSASSVVSQSRKYGRLKYEALGLVTRARAARQLGLQTAASDASASVEIGRRLADPAVLLECLLVSLNLEGSDELHAEATGVAKRIASTISHPSRRSRFLANLSSLGDLRVVTP